MLALIESPHGSRACAARADVNWYSSRESSLVKRRRRDVEYPVTVHGGQVAAVLDMLLQSFCSRAQGSAEILSTGTWSTSQLMTTGKASTLAEETVVRIGERVHHDARLTRRRMSDRPVAGVDYEMGRFPLRIKSSAWASVFNNHSRLRTHWPNHPGKATAC